MFFSKGYGVLFYQGNGLLVQALLSTVLRSPLARQRAGCVIHTHSSQLQRQTIAYPTIQTDRWTVGRSDGQISGWTNGWTMDEGMRGQIDGETNGRTDR